MLLRHSRRPDPKARKVALQIGATRMALGTAVLLAAEPTLHLLGFERVEPAGRALARLAGGRDIALGALTVAARNDRARLRTLMLASSACDLADAVGLGLSATHPETRKAGLGGIFSGGASALAGSWAARRLGS